MNQRIYKITAIKVVSPFTMEIIFSDGLKKTIDFLPMLKGEMYGPLADELYFKKICLNKDVHTIEWPNGADFDPEILYNWESYKAELVKRAEMWV